MRTSGPTSTLFNLANGPRLYKGTFPKVTAPVDGRVRDHARAAPNVSRELQVEATTGRESGHRDACSRVAGCVCPYTHIGIDTKISSDQGEDENESRRRDDVATGAT